MIWLLLLSAAFLGGTYYCYITVFAVLPRHQATPHLLPKGAQYQALRTQAHALIDAALAIPFQDVAIQSHDGLRLYGRLYEQDPKAPTQILFHGYRSNALLDFSGGLQLALKSGCNALLVDQRAHGQSQGKCLAFGVQERWDCREWVRFVSDRYGPDAPIVLTGISMGAATVLMAAELELPGNVVGVIGDCGYSSPRAILRKVMKDRHYPLLLYPLIRLTGRLWGGFDVESASPAEALQRTRLPVLLIHGEADRFVPCAMSRENYDACRSEKYLLTVPGAGHGLSYLVDTQGYCAAVEQFLSRLPLHP